MKFYRFAVVGRVQGVGFRIAAQRKAIFLGLRGWVRNREDGAVAGAVAGEVFADLATFRAWLHCGPSGSRVDVCEWSITSEVVDEDSFVIRR